MPIPDVHILQDGLWVRRVPGALALQWQCGCPFHDIVVERHMCEGLYREFAPAWLAILSSDSAPPATIGDICLHKVGREVSLTFTRAFINPKTLLLSASTTSELRQLLEEFVREPIPATAPTPVKRSTVSVIP